MNNWAEIDPVLAKRVGLAYGPSDLREMNGCIYKRDERGIWWELQVPPLPVPNQEELQ